VAIAAHPFRPELGLGDLIYDLPLDGIEVFNINHQAADNLAAREACRKLKVAELGGSDAHAPSYVGHFLTYFEREIGTEEELVREIRARRCRAITYADIYKS